MAADPKAGAQAIKRAWSALALFTFNLLAAFGLLNLAVYAVQRAAAPPPDLGLVVQRHGLEHVARAYPGWNRADLEVLLRESLHGFDNVYEPYTEFRPSPLQGRYVNVGPEGVRRTPGSTWPPEPGAYRVFVFGGSTTFGAGAPDEQTIPAYLAQSLPREACGRPLRVYNLGRPAYLGVQERLLFEQLLAAGTLPDLAVFVDGLNEFYLWPRPLSAELMAKAIERSQSRGLRAELREALEALPAVRAVRSWGKRVASAPDPHAPRPSPEAVLAEWQANQDMVRRVAASFGVRTLFVWQPVPCYRYDLKHHLFYTDEGFEALTPERMRRGYELMEARRQGLPDFLWLGDLQEGWAENLYVTTMHYRPPLAEAIAKRVAAHLQASGLLACPATR